MNEIKKLRIDCAYDELANIHTLKENPDNPRDIEKDALVRLKKMIVTLGFFRPQIINEDRMVLGGNQRLKALLELESDGYDCSKVPISFYKDKSNEKNVAIADNTNAGKWIPSLLEGYLDNIGNLDLEITGLSDSDLEEIGIEIDSGPDSCEDEDEIPEVENKEPITKKGDLWELGGHRLMCGDSTMIDDVERLMGGEKVDSLMTDSPYGVDYSSKNEFLNNMDKGNRIQVPIKNDTIENYREWFASFLSLVPFNDYNTFYIWMFGKELHNLMLAIDDCDCVWGDYLVWVKNNHVLGRKDYNAKHEFCVYGWKGKHKFYGDFSTTILEYAKPQKNDLHPTMKPVEMIAKLIIDGSPKNGIVLDLFGGSGTTLIACEKTGRQCRLMEIDPHYCDVIVRRYINLYGNEDIFLNDKPYERKNKE